jgi:hypothetical protein
METEELLKHAYGRWEKICEKIEEEYSEEDARDILLLLTQRVMEMGNTVCEEENKKFARLALRVGTKEDLAKAARDKKKLELTKAALKTTKCLIKSEINNRLLRSSKADLETELSDSEKRATRLRKERNAADAEVEELRAQRDRLAEELGAYKDASKRAVKVLEDARRAKMPRLGTQTGKYEFEKVADAKVKEGPWADKLTKETVEKMKVPQLRAALDDRSLDTQGLKSDLKERLLGAIEDGKTN